jgi:hypothetical protein
VMRNGNILWIRLYAYYLAILFISQILYRTHTLDDHQSLMEYTRGSLVAMLLWAKRQIDRTTMHAPPLGIGNLVSPRLQWMRYHLHNTFLINPITLSIGRIQNNQLKLSPAGILCTHVPSDLLLLQHRPL